MKRIYIAGSYNADNVCAVLANIRRGVEFCARLVVEGYAPFCPWLDWQFSMFESLTVEQYRAYSLAWLDVSEELWVLPDSEDSKGTQAEIARAVMRGIPVRLLTEKEVAGKPLHEAKGNK